MTRLIISTTTVAALLIGTGTAMAQYVVPSDEAYGYADPGPPPYAYRHYVPRRAWGYGSEPYVSRLPGKDETNSRGAILYR